MKSKKKGERSSHVALALGRKERKEGGYEKGEGEGGWNQQLPRVL